MLEISIESSGYNSSYDITDQISSLLPHMDKPEGLLKICTVGTTLGLVLMRHEPGAEQDLFEALEHIAPSAKEYGHFRTTGDGNGFAHVWSSLIGCSVILPYRNHELAVSKSHRVVLLDFDLQAATRKVYIDI